MGNEGFASFADCAPDATAIVDPQGVAWSRERFSRLSNRIARAFRAQRLSAGDVVAIVAPNCAEYLAVYFAAIQAGLYVVPVDWHLAEEETRFVLRNSDARIVVGHPRLGAIRLAAVAANRAEGSLLVSIGRVPGWMALEEFISTQPAKPLRVSVSGRVMAYTSATTGRPKAVRLPLKNAQEALRRIIRWHRSLGIEPGGDNVHLCSSMLYHSAPLEGAVIALHMGHTVVLDDHWEPESFLRAIERHAVTTVFMVPAMFVRLLKLVPGVRERYSTSSLRFVIHAGAPCPSDVKRRMIEWWGPIIWESYGAAEGQGAVISSREWLERPGSVGKPIPGSRFKVVSGEGEELPSGRVGTLYMVPYTGDRFEYKDDPEKTRMSYSGDFITVGDVGYRDEDGYIFLCDREADVIISSGMNIYPAEIEHVLVQHEAVMDCAVLGVPHEFLGEVPKAIVQLMPGALPGPRLTADLLRFLGARLSSMKLPKRIEYVPRLPRDPAGKLRKRLLPDRALGSAGRA